MLSVQESVRIQGSVNFALKYQPAASDLTPGAAGCRQDITGLGGCGYTTPCSPGRSYFSFSWART